MSIGYTVFVLRDAGKNTKINSQTLRAAKDLRPEFQPLLLTSSFSKLVLLIKLRPRFGKGSGR